jgi:hypothetical protein
VTGEYHIGPYKNSDHRQKVGDRSTHNVLVGKPEGRAYMGEYEGACCTDLTQDRDQWLDVVKMVINLQGPYMLRI